MHACNAWCRDDLHAETVLANKALPLEALKASLEQAEPVEIVHIRPATEVAMHAVWAKSEWWFSSETSCDMPRPPWALVALTHQGWLVLWRDKAGVL